jgi:hypothetical protein
LFRWEGWGSWPVLFTGHARPNQEPARALGDTPGSCMRMTRWAAEQ